jgi:hypothetical protein
LFLNTGLLHVGDAVRGDFASEYINEATYRAGFGAVSAVVLIGPQLGLGRAALNRVIAEAPRRSITYTVYREQANSTAFQLQVAQAATKLDTAHLHALRAADAIDMPRIAMSNSTISPGRVFEPTRPTQRGRSASRSPFY